MIQRHSATTSVARAGKLAHRGLVSERVRRQTPASPLVGQVEVAAEQAHPAGIASGDLFCHHDLVMLLRDRDDTAVSLDVTR